MEPDQMRISRRVLKSITITISFFVVALGLGLFVVIPSLWLPSNNTPSIWCTFVFLYVGSISFGVALIASVYADSHTTLWTDGVVKQGLFRRKQILWNTVIGVEIDSTTIILFNADCSIYITLSRYANPEPIRAFILAHLPADLLASLEPSE